MKYISLLHTKPGILMLVLNINIHHDLVITDDWQGTVYRGQQVLLPKATLLFTLDGTVMKV